MKIPKEISLDLETYSSADIKSSGHYKYVESPDFEILLMAYRYDDGEVKIVDFSKGETFPKNFVDYLQDPRITKRAFNASFERVALRQYGIETDPIQWRCTMVLSAVSGLPLSLAEVSKTLKLGDQGKMNAGRALIRYFSIPCKPTKSNGMRYRNFHYHDPEKWEEFKEYCRMDVVAESAIVRMFRHNDLSDYEQELYALDQKINDKGVQVDRALVDGATVIDEIVKNRLMRELITLTGLDNPNSNKQFAEWLGDAIGEEVKSVGAESLSAIREDYPENKIVQRALNLKQELGKTSIGKYHAMTRAVKEDGRISGMLQFYGANRTGRWAGRLVQLQNLPRNNMKSLDLARNTVLEKDFDSLSLMFNKPAAVLSQLIRTALVSKEGHSFIACDFSAIEARVLAWMAGEEWRLEIFRTHGKIYEASIAAMRGIPIEKVTQEQRQEGKVYELALGYQGSIGAMIQFGADKMGMTEEDMKKSVSVWRKTSPSIARFWKLLDTAAVRTVSLRRPTRVKLPYLTLIFQMEGETLTITLPSGRKLRYFNAKITEGRFGQPAIKYEGNQPITNVWGFVQSYGGKIVENVVQAFSRDLLAEKMIILDNMGFNIVMHIHDEIVVEELDERAEEALETMEQVMGEPISWAPNLPLKAEGFITKYYKKED